MWEWLLYVNSWYSLEDDFLKMYNYKTITELTNCQEVCCYVQYTHIILKNWLKKIWNIQEYFQDGSFVTHGIVKDTYFWSRWSFCGCPLKNCLAGVREKNGWYHCWRYEDDYVSFVFRYLWLPFFLFWFGKSDFFHFILILILIILLPRLTFLLMLV
jgi:hypothetical protein